MAGTVTLATLIRGQSYKHLYQGAYVAFLRNVPRIVDDALADDLEDLIDEVNTEEKHVIEVDRFKIERDVPADRIEKEEEAQVRVRTKMVRETVPIRKKPALRKVPAVKKSAGFKGRRSSSE